MRTKLAVAALVAGVAATVAPATPASAYCSEPIVVLDDGSGGGGGGQTCTNECYTTGEAYENATAELQERFEVVPSYWDLFACLD